MKQLIETCAIGAPDKRADALKVSSAVRVRPAA
jgi:hypothetical protein